jgi:hypothetical protein
VVDDRDHRRQEKGEWGEPRIGSAPPEQDAQPDTQEAGDEQEVGEEADVLDVGRDPADEQQLDEEDREARQEEPNVVTRE